MNEEELLNIFSEIHYWEHYDKNLALGNHMVEFFIMRVINKYSQIPANKKELLDIFSKIRYWEHYNKDPVLANMEIQKLIAYVIDFYSKTLTMDKEISSIIYEIDYWRHYDKDSKLAHKEIENLIFFIIDYYSQISVEKMTNYTSLCFRLLLCFIKDYKVEISEQDIIPLTQAIDRYSRYCTTKHM